MKRTLPALGALLATTSIAAAGGIDRTGSNYSFLFQDGNYAELSFSSVRPSVSGNYPTALGGGSTDGLAKDYTTVSLSYKHQFTDQFAVGFALNEPFGADAAYTSGAYTGLAGEWESRSATVLLAYKATPNVTVYGGPRYTTSKSSTSIPAALFPGGYNVESDKNSQISYVVGAAYERPEIGLRVGLTYESGFTHDSKTVETLAGGAQVVESETEVDMPSSLILDFQTGVAKDTLVFGQIKRTDWDWRVRPTTYGQLTNDDIVAIEGIVNSYQLGVGRRINDQLSVFARVGYEKSDGEVASRLAPTDGRRSIGIGGSYNFDNVTLRGGVEYVKLGDAVDASNVKFEDNSAVGIGISVGYSF